MWRLIDSDGTVFLHPYSEKSWDDQLTRESLAERTVRATVHARKTLLAGFTTVRYGSRRRALFALRISLYLQNLNIHVLGISALKEPLIQTLG